jgi:hypothetical protein
LHVPGEQIGPRIAAIRDVKHANACHRRSAAAATASIGASAMFRPATPNAIDDELIRRLPALGESARRNRGSFHRDHQ